MSSVAKIILLLALFLPGIAVADRAAPDALALREACSAGSQAKMRECLSAKAVASASALKQAERQMARALTRWDEDDTYREEAAGALAAANNSFARYRAEECAFEKALGGGAAGNTAEMLRLSCESALNDWRATRLQRSTSDVPGR